jgi:hypothetical protein
MSLGQNYNPTNKPKEITVTDKVSNPIFFNRSKVKFASLKDWIFKICEDKSPEKLISEFKVDLKISTTNRVTISFYGVNTYIGGYNSDTRIEYEPVYMFFNPTIDKYIGLKKDDLLKMVIAELDDVINSKKFKSSFLNRMGKINLYFNGLKISLNV